MKTLDQIRTGLDNEEFLLAYQPIVSLVDGRCIGAEALVRWQRGEELIMPDQFIPAIEGTPLSGLLSYWSIEQIGADLMEWLEDNPKVHLGFNVSPDVLGRGGLQYAVRKSGLDHLTDRLVCEITERGFPDQQALDSLDFRGHVKIAVDDFGTGDANLKQLTQIEADIIKIDRWFVEPIMEGAPIPRGIRGLTAFAAAMDCEMIAEGIETRFQAETLAGMGVQMGQGWLFSKALPPAEFLAFFRDH